jgi:hypothetical protein
MIGLQGSVVKNCHEHYAAVKVNSAPPWSDTRHLSDTWGKNSGPEFDTFSPGTEYNFFLRFEGSELTIISPCFERKARYSTLLLLISVKIGEILNHTHLLLATAIV